MSILEMAREARERPMVLAKFFEKPKCRPWDLVKGRRFSCCHGKGEHMPFCFSRGITWSAIEMGQLSAEDLIDN